MTRIFRESGPFHHCDPCYGNCELCQGEEVEEPDLVRGVTWAGVLSVAAAVLVVLIVAAAAVLRRCVG